MGNSSLTGWRLKDVIVVAILAVIFGGIYYIMDPIYVAIEAVLKPMGLGIYTGAATIGPWMMAAPLATLLVKRAGAGILGEILAAAGEVLYGGIWGLSTLLSGIIQGGASELGFTVALYKKWYVGLWLSTITGTVITFCWAWFHEGYSHLGFGTVVCLFLVRLASIVFFDGVLVYAIVNLLQRAHLVKK